ncbi:MAG: hypothetical protein CM1200mP24_01510 [Gammaproteobacteria bacterium]|nr:MAG: hypothetical protein CM1200mP24_01510 [Gammaproteobacteria bacterium]
MPVVATLKFTILLRPVKPRANLMAVIVASVPELNPTHKVY